MPSSFRYCYVSLLALLLWAAGLHAAYGQGLGALRGPQRACTGSVVTFTVDSLSAVRDLQWTLPPGMSIVAGAGYARVQVLVGGTGGTVSVQGTTPTGPSSISALQIRVEAPSANRGYLLVGRLPLGLQDQSLKARLQAFGYQITEVTDQEANPALGGCGAFVYVSPTARPGVAGPALVGLQGGLITANVGTWPALGLTGNAPADTQTAPGAQVQALPLSHELNGGLPPSVQSVYSIAAKIQTGRPLAEGIVVARGLSAGSLPAFFGYERGAALAQGMAVGRRVAFFADSVGQQALTAIGNRFLERAVCWAARRCPPAAARIVTQPLVRLRYCPGDTMRVAWTVTGSFGTVPANVFQVELSDGNGAWFSPTLLGSVMGAGAGSLWVRLPAGLANGTAYRVRVVATNPTVLGSDNGAGIIISNQAAAPPATVAGPDTVCLAQLPSYTAAAVPGAIRYDWMLPAGLSTTDTGQTARINLTGATDNTTYTVQVRAITICGPGETRTFTIRVQSAAVVPPIGAISTTTAGCPQWVRYSVGPVAGATAYTWITPTGTQTGTASAIVVRYTAATAGEVKAVAQTACGTTDTTRLAVNIPEPARALVLYAAGASLSPAETVLRNRLLQLGYTVSLFTPTSPLPVGGFCARAVVVSPGVGLGQGLQRLDTLRLPILTLNPTGALALGMVGAAAFGLALDSLVRIGQPTHPLAADLQGDVALYRKRVRLAGALPLVGGTSVAEERSAGRSVLFAFEQNEQMSARTAPARRVAMGLDGRLGLDSMSLAGLTLLDKAVCYVAGTCLPNPTTVLPGPTHRPAYCAGDTIRLTVATQGAFGVGNQLSLEISDAAGGFGAPTTLLTLVAGQDARAALPRDLAPSNRYRIRVRATDPALVGAASADSIRIENPGFGVVLRPDTVCPGQGARIVLAGLQPGAWYRVALPGLDSLRAAGQGGVLAVPELVLGNVPVRRLPVVARSGLCPARLLADSATVVQRRFAVLGAVLSGPSSVCAGQPFALRVFPVPAALRFSVLRNGVGVAPAALAQLGDTLRITLNPAGWPTGLQTLRLRVQIPPCGDSVLPAQWLVAVRNPPRRNLQLTAPRVCYADTVRILINSTEPGVGYQALVRGAGVGDSLAGTGGPLTLRIPTSALPAGGVFARVHLAVAGCLVAVSDDSVGLAFTPMPRGGLGVDTAVICPGSREARLTLATPQPQHRYRLLRADGTILAEGQAGATGGLGLQVPTFATLPGLYALRLEAAGAGCGFVPVADTAYLRVAAAPNLNLAVTGGAYCAGQPAKVTISRSEPGFSYQLLDGATPVGAPLPGTGGPITLSWPTPTGSPTLAVRVSVPGCQAQVLAERVTVRPKVTPVTRFTRLAVASLCPGQILSLPLRQVAAGYRYQLWANGLRAADSLLPEAEGLVWPLPYDRLPQGPVRLQLRVEDSACYGRLKLDSLNVFVGAATEARLAVRGILTCNPALVRVLVERPQARVRYLPLVDGRPAGAASEAANADSLPVAVVLPPGQAQGWVRILAQGPCDTALLADSAWVEVLPTVNTTLRIAATDSLPCINTTAVFSLGSTGLRGIQWRLPARTRATYNADSTEIELTWLDYPLERDSLVAVRRFGCGGRARGRILLARPASCERIYVPNILTPLTADGNQLWDIRGLGAFGRFRLRVFNAWGSVVHEAQGNYAPWDGKSNGAMLPSGTYYYVLEPGPGQTPVTGSITLINNP